MGAEVWKAVWSVYQDRKHKVIEYGVGALGTIIFYAAFILSVRARAKAKAKVAAAKDNAGSEGGGGSGGDNGREGRVRDLRAQGEGAVRRRR